MTPMILVFSVLFAALLSGVRQARVTALAIRRRHLLTIAVSLALVICLTIQLQAAGALELFERDAQRIRAGEVWRILTALFFQDGKLAGGISNIVWLVVIGIVAERLLSRTAWSLIYFGGGMLTELVALWLQPIGAGNSVANLSLAGAILALGAMRRSALLRVLAVVGIASGVGLLVLRDIHGAATLIGAAGGAVFVILERRQRRGNSNV